MFDLELFLSAFAILFVLIDPPGCAPIFATLTKGTSRKHQHEMAIKSVVVATIVLVLFVYGGEWVFEKLGISLNALRIAGGIMLFMIGLNMVFEKRSETREERAEEVLNEHAQHPEDISVFPMGIPMIAGPGTMTSLILLTSENNSFQGYATILSALLVVMIITLLTFLIAGPLMKLMGKSVTAVITRLLGVLLCTLAAQFLIDGIVGAMPALGAFPA